MNRILWNKTVSWHINRLVGVVLIILMMWIAGGFWTSRQIPFDGQMWKAAGSALHPDIRFRMVQDAIRNLKKDPELNYNDIRAILGAPTRETVEGRFMCYDLGRRFVGPIPIRQYRLRITVNEQDVVSAITVIPE